MDRFSNFNLPRALPCYWHSDWRRQQIFGNMFRLRRLPDSVVYERGPEFKFKFSIYIIIKCGIQLKIRTSRHPQTDGATEILKLMVAKYVRCYFAFLQRDWDSILISANFAYSPAQVDLFSMSSFEVDSSWSPKSPFIFAIELWQKRRSYCHRFLEQVGEDLPKCHLCTAFSPSQAGCVQWESLYDSES